MHTIATLPKAKISGIYSLESKVTRLAESCDYLELPLKYTDRLLVVDTKDGRLHRQCTVGCLRSQEENLIVCCSKRFITSMYSSEEETLITRLLLKISD